MKIAVCDDEQIYLDKISKELLGLEGYEGEFKITEYLSGEELIADFSANAYDIIILDIEMKQMNGMETAEHIRKLDSMATIIFLTNYDSFAPKGYLVGAFRYILKEQPHELYIQQLKDTIQSVYNKRQYMPVNINGEIRKISINDIIYIEVFGHNLQMYMTDANIAYKGRLKDAEEYLTGYDFVRTDKSHLVNADMIRSKNGDVLLMENGVKIYISRKYNKSVSNAFMTCVRRRCG